MEDLHTHTSSTQTYNVHIHLDVMDTLFIALSALVSCFCVARSCIWCCLLMTGFMDYGESSSTAGMLNVDCDCKCFPVFSFFPPLPLFWRFHFRSFKVQKCAALWAEMCRLFIMLCVLRSYVGIHVHKFCYNKINLIVVSLWPAILQQIFLMWMGICHVCNKLVSAKINRLWCP